MEEDLPVPRCLESPSLGLALGDLYPHSDRVLSIVGQPSATAAVTTGVFLGFQPRADRLLQSPQLVLRVAGPAPGFRLSPCAFDGNALKVVQHR